MVAMSSWFGSIAGTRVMHWLAVQPPVDGILASLATTQVVQALSSMFLGTAEVPPVTLLSVIVGCFASYTMVLLMIPKGRLSIWAFCYFFLSSDKKTQKPNDAPCDATAPSCKRMKVVFIRHGESEWNAVFNEGSKLTLPVRLAVALFHEALMFFEQDSMLIDSPLSEVGVQQAWDLMTFLASQPARALENDRASLPVKDLEVAELVAIIRGDAGESILVSSILRRAISTGLIAVSPRLLKTSALKDKVQLMTTLQEISRNVDTLALTPARMLPQIPAGEAKTKHMGDIVSHFYRTRLDRRNNNGNKTVYQQAIDRQLAFVKWLLEQKTDCVIVFGHSLWFQEFFKSFLPKASKHQAKTSKICNGGCVAFDFYKDSRNVHRIPPESVKVVYGGFAVKGKKKDKLA